MLYLLLLHPCSITSRGFWTCNSLILMSCICNTWHYLQSCLIRISVYSSEEVAVASCTKTYPHCTFDLNINYFIQKKWIGRDIERDIAPLTMLLYISKHSKYYKHIWTEFSRYWRVLNTTLGHYSENPYAIIFFWIVPLGLCSEISSTFLHLFDMFSAIYSVEWREFIP